MLPTKSGFVGGKYLFSECTMFSVDPFIVWHIHFAWKKTLPTQEYDEPKKVNNLMVNASFIPTPSNYEVVLVSSSLIS